MMRLLTGEYMHAVQEFACPPMARAPACSTLSGIGSCASSGLLSLVPTHQASANTTCAAETLLFYMREKAIIVISEDTGVKAHHVFQHVLANDVLLPEAQHQVAVLGEHQRAEELQAALWQLDVEHRGLRVQRSERALPCRQLLQLHSYSTRTAVMSVCIVSARGRGAPCVLPQVLQAVH